jgi:hypothetical protein
MRFIKYLSALIIIGSLAQIDLYSQTNSNSMLLDGTETLVQYGIDTTGSWWAITQPFSSQYRAHINGKESPVYQELKGLAFSLSGAKWAFFGKNNTGWNIFGSDTSFQLSSTDVGEIIFSAINSKLCYTAFESNQEYLYFNDKKISLYEKFGKVYLNPNGNKYAYISKRGSSYILNINGQESSNYDDILPIGFWHNNQFMYAARNGDNWEIYKDFKSISEMYKGVYEPKINNSGTAAAMILKLNSSYYQTVLYSDEYIEPLYSGQYDNMSDLALHPTEPTTACKAILNNAYYVLLNSTEYSAAEEISKPQFTYDGSEMYFISCNVNCNLSVNGKKYKMANQFDINTEFVKKPGSMTICYPTSSTIILQSIDSGELFGSLLIDRISQTIYNWRSSRYEALAVISNRLYLLGAKP